MEWLNDFLSPSWDDKFVSTGSDVVKCVIDPSTILFHYVICNVELHIAFKYMCFTRDEDTWSPMDSPSENVTMINVLVTLCEQVIHEMYVEQGWTLADV